MFLLQSTFFFITALLLSASAIAQSYTISGYINDAENGETLIGANIQIIDTPNRSVSNDYGFYSFLASEGKVTLKVSYVGYETVEQTFYLHRDTLLNVSLKTLSLKEIVVHAQGGEQLQEQTQMSVVHIPMKQMEKVPGLGGENDILKVLSTTPGVSNGLEGTAGILVRGGSTDQNLILLDDAVVYNVSHVNGFLSVFNTDAINNVELLKGGFPARYGGRLSSVLNITMKEGNNQKITGKVGLGAVASDFLLEGPLVKNKSSFMVSARGSTFSLLRLPLKMQFEKGKKNTFSTFGFYDINAKVNYKLNDRNRLFFSFYQGHDTRFDENRTTYGTERNSLNWGNTTLSMRYNHIINPKLFMKTIASYTHYQYNLDSDGTRTIFGVDTIKNYYTQINQSGITDFTLKTAFDYTPANEHKIKFGAEITRHIYTPSIQSGRFKSTQQNALQDTTVTSASKIHANELSLFAEDEWDISKKVSLNAGLRGVGFMVDNKWYGSVEPRASVRWVVGRNWAVKSAYSYMQQYLHLLSNNGFGFPNDIWVPATKRIAPQKSQQIALGLSKTFQKSHIDISIEGYYKWMNQLVDYQEGANFLFNYQQDWQDLVETKGKGWSYGAEVFLHRKTGHLTGWVSYTLSWNNRQFENINKGETYPFKYDRRHNLSIVTNYEFSRHFSISYQWTYQTGNAVTFPVGHYYSPGLGTFDIFSERNNYRLKPYRRADLSLNFTKFNKKNSQKSLWSIGAYNLFNRANPYYLTYFKSDDGTVSIYQKSLLPFVPYLSYHKSF